MKKLLMTALLLIGLFTTVQAGKITASSPFGAINLEVNDGVPPPREIIQPGATPMSGSFTVYYYDGMILRSFQFYYSDGTTLTEIINILMAFFGMK